MYVSFIIKFIDGLKMEVMIVFSKVGEECFVVFGEGWVCVKYLKDVGKVGGVFI